ncbi:unnamed protein product [Blepharisma stoltei]|uniref:Macro domain-containing protein n=1 Tax=Blepharisma stoltei TaxID=1481888 RepID=A0AAU9IBZ5_9CILI|nr:unnamed protein product [Blepharisma stoltei]
MERAPILLLQASLNGIELEIRQGSVLNLRTDAIVNAANEKLENVGGLAGQISNLAGPQLENECREYIRRNGLLQPGKIVNTSAGNLPFSFILHTVGPSTGKSSFNDCDQLVSAIFGAIEAANVLQLTSIGIPGISCGIFGFPIIDAARCHIDSFIIYAGNFILKNPNTTLKKIVFSLYTENEALTFLEAALEKNRPFDDIVYHGTLREQGSGSKFGYCHVCNDLVENPDLYMNICQMAKCCRDVCNFCIFQQCLYNCPIHHTRFADDVINGINLYILCKECKSYKLVQEKVCECRQVCRECILKINQGREYLRCICRQNIPYERYNGLI